MEQLGAMAGVITTSNWIMSKNGDTHVRFWAPKWVIVTDKMMGAAIGQDTFRSNEKWTLAAYEGDRLLALFPGCQVRGFVPCEKNPKPRECCDLSEEK